MAVVLLMCWCWAFDLSWFLFIAISKLAEVIYSFKCLARVFKAFGTHGRVHADVAFCAVFTLAAQCFLEVGCCYLGCRLV